MLEINKSGKIPVYIQIYEELKNQIISGEMKAGERLIATRTLAQDYHLSRNTVLLAYQQLESEGFVSSKIGSGFYVEEIPKIADTRPETETAADSETKKETYPYDFRYGSIEPNVYVTRGFRKALKEALSQLEEKQTLQDCEPQGLLSLRQALCDHLREVRGVITKPEQIVITSGHHYSLKLLSEVFSDRYRTLALEDPGHQDTREVFAKAGYEILPIPLDDNGIQTSQLLSHRRVLAYVTPSHQFPLGTILPVGRRLQLLKWAQESDSFLIEDDYDSELRYRERPVPALYSLDSHERVIYLGSFSKSLSPDLRVSYIVFPESLKPSASLFSSSASLLIQMTLSEYLRSKEYRKRINQIRNALRKKHSRIIDFLRNHYDDLIRIYGIGGGTHFVLKLPTELSEEEILLAFHEEETCVYPASQYFFDSADHHNMILIGYSGIPLSELDEYLEHLKKGIDRIIEK
ncbi:MAG: PLP-dependent aminotransferase family protein [Erysipelotrichaceae bacterium]|nr:PLP-dependent aminotransferase family protein [Erysipelotrichaceae bacterium]